MPRAFAMPMPPATNRRNLYRLLQVQPEAPTEVIHASYRALMRRLHPDMGGDHLQAAWANAAWEVLRDPQRRAAYDRQQLARQIQARQRGLGSAPRRQATPTGAEAQAEDAPAGVCALCGRTFAVALRPLRCLACEAPLRPVPSVASTPELLGRRAAVRKRREAAAVACLPGEGGAWWPVRWHDLSLRGLSVTSTRPLAPGVRVHLKDEALEVVAQVVHCRPVGRQHRLHARLLTLLLRQPQGVFLRATA